MNYNKSAYPDFNNLWQVIRELGIESTSKFEIKQINTTGLDVNVENNIIRAESGLYSVLSDGTIKKVLLYIAEQQRWVLNTYGEHLPKYHIYNCSTVSTMHLKKKKDRYKVSTRKDGFFYLVVADNGRVVEEKSIKLDLCKNCLAMYNKKHNKNITIYNFNIQEFINEDLDSILPEFDFDYEAKPNTYTKDWHLISSMLKKKKNYTCEKCSIKLEHRDYQQFLHVHHIDSNKSNNKSYNLKVLCIDCHSKEFNHSHIKNSNMFKKFLAVKKS